MTIVQEVNDLFAKLASHISGASSFNSNVVEEDDAVLNLAISNLNRSLNLDEISEVRVLDTVLSLMCFKAPHVYDSVIQYLVGTIVSVLSSSICCKVVRSPKDEVFLIGSSILRRDIPTLIEACSDILDQLEGHGALYNSLLYAVVRASTSSSCYRCLYPSKHILDMRSVNAKIIAVSKMRVNLPQELPLNNNKVPIRLLLWYLDPQILKHDITIILKESCKRPFLCLRREFHERMDWRSIMTCMVLSPIMFIETRALLHRWFLLTGLTSVLELVTAFSSVMLDVVSRPMSWGIPLELGAKLPFSSAYFPYNHCMLRILSGALSHGTFIKLVQITRESISCAKKQHDPTINPPAVNSDAVDHKSIWALAISFPDWLCFASALLFSQDKHKSKIPYLCTLEVSNNRETHNEELSSIAAGYIAWILSPLGKSHQDLLADYLIKMSKSWTSKQFGSGTHEKKTASNQYQKTLKKHKYCEEDTPPGEYSCKTITLFLNEFKCMYSSCSNKNITNIYGPHEGKSSSSIPEQKIAPFRRIPLGILLGCLEYIDENGCELLLHYAATDRILQSRESSTCLNNLKRKPEGQKDALMQTDECNKKDVVASVSLVFSLTDIAERMSASLFDTEVAGREFISQLKMKSGKYLTKCIKRLIQLKVAEDDDSLVMDLFQRLKQWRHQGQIELKVPKDLDDIINILSRKFSSL